MDALIVPWTNSDGELAYKELGFVKTVGTVFAQPPPDSILLSSFQKQHNPKANLTVGARALSKHFMRSRTKKTTFWNEPTGTESEKNKAALDHFFDIMSTAVWRNIHLLHKECLIYELRNKNGYGMRWQLLSINYTINDVIFRGFLEPNI